MQDAEPLGMQMASIEFHPWNQRRPRCKAFVESGSAAERCSFSAPAMIHD